MSLPIPIVDLLEDSEIGIQKLRDACTEHGFFFLRGHGVSKDVVQDVYKQSSRFFSLPEKEKMKYEAIGNRGYTGLGEQTLDPGNQKRGDTKESFYVSLPEAEAGSERARLPFHGQNRWPVSVPEFKPAMEVYMAALYAAYAKLLVWITAALNLPAGYFDDSFKDPILTLRPIHYTAEMSAPEMGVYGAGAHTDWGFTTLVETNNTPGLELFYKGTWHAVPSLPETFVVNIGDLLERWSNGVFKSTLHRVVNRTPGKERHSCAFFVAPQYDTKVRCLPSCVGDGEKFEAVTCAEYLQSKYKQTHANFTASAS